MLETVDLTRRLDRDSYVREVTRRQIQLRELGYQIYLRKRPVVIAFEGWDAGGKGGAIKRITEKLDPAATWSTRSPRRVARTRHAIISTASGGAFRNADRSPSSTGPGTAGCWWSVWRVSPRKRNGNGPSRRSTRS